MTAGAGALKTKSPGKPRKRMRRPEQVFQASLVKALAMVLERDAFLFAVPNGGARSKIEAKILVGQGVVPGVPDLLVMFSGTAVGLECKAPQGGRTDPNQIKVHERFARAGIPVAVVRTLPEALAFLHDNNVPMRIKDIPR